jgi:glutathione S-transferase
VASLRYGECCTYPSGLGEQRSPHYEEDMSSVIEIHGRLGCPFAWRARLAAAEKSVPFEWIPFDAQPPDARAAKNTAQRSPLLIHGDFQLTESAVIAQYIDEAFPGPALQPSEPAPRALARVDSTELQKLEADTRPGVVPTPEVRARINQGFELLDKKLGHGGPWLGGETPNLTDLLIWPMLTGLVLRLGLTIPPALTRATAYWQRVVQRPSYHSTRPQWVVEATGAR